MSTQVTYTVSIIGDNLSSLYSGELTLQIDNSGGMGPTVSAGLLSLNSFAPLLLSSVQGLPFWSLSGSNGGLNVSTSWIRPTVLSAQQVPTRIAGYIVISAGGGAQQTLPIMGFCAAPAAAEAPSAGLAAAAPSAASGDSFNYQLALLDDSFKQVNSGQLQATGNEVRIGPVSKMYHVTGTLELNQPSVSISVQGYGSPMFWTVRGSEGGTSVELSIVVGVSGTGTSDGNLTLDGTGQFFVVGSPGSN